jgi:hypothetical protein
MTIQSEPHACTNLGGDWIQGRQAATIASAQAGMAIGGEVAAHGHIVDVDSERGGLRNRTIARRLQPSTAVRVCAPAPAGEAIGSSHASGQKSIENAQRHQGFVAAQRGRMPEPVAGHHDAVKRSPRLLARVVQRQEPFEPLPAANRVGRAALALYCHGTVRLLPCRRPPSGSRPLPGSSLLNGRSVLATLVPTWGSGAGSLLVRTGRRPGARPCQARVERAALPALLGLAPELGELMNADLKRQPTDKGITYREEPTTATRSVLRSTQGRAARVSDRFQVHHTGYVLQSSVRNRFDAAIPASCAMSESCRCATARIHPRAFGEPEVHPHRSNEVETQARKFTRKPCSGDAVCPEPATGRSAVRDASRSSGDRHVSGASPLRPA